MTLLKAFHQLPNYLLMIQESSLLSMTSMYLLTKFRRDVYVVLSVENVIHLDNSKQAQEITYSKKKRNFLHPPFLQ